VLVNGQQLIREVDLASIGMQEIKAQDTLFLYFSTEPTVPEESPEAQCPAPFVLSVDESSLPSHSSDAAVHWLDDAWFNTAEEIRQKCCSLYLQ